jgi:hypothetical protein
MLFFDQKFSAARQRVFFVFLKKCVTRPYTSKSFTAANMHKNASKKHVCARVCECHPRTCRCVLGKHENQIPPCCLRKPAGNWCLQVLPRKIGVRVRRPPKTEIRCAGEMCKNGEFWVVSEHILKFSRKHEKTRKCTFRPWAFKWFFDFFRSMQFQAEKTRFTRRSPENAHRKLICNFPEIFRKKTIRKATYDK